MSTNTQKLLGTDEDKIKFTKERAKLAKEIDRQRKILEKNFIQDIPKNLSAEELRARQDQATLRARQQFYPIIPIPEIYTGNGDIVSKHKNKLGFIYIGDTFDADDNSELILNTPKIAMIVGGGLDNARDGGGIDPRKDHILGVSAQLHLISAADIDVAGILPISNLYNRSAVKAEADIIELSGTEAVFIRSLGRPYNSSGARVLTPGGVHIISGQHTEDKPLTPEEPMVLGQGLSDALFAIVEQVSTINTVLGNVIQDIMALKASLIAHTHITTAPTTPTSPSPDLAASVAPTIVANNALDAANTSALTVNLEMLKLNHLTGLSPKSFLSKYNRVN